MITIGIRVIFWNQNKYRGEINLFERWWFGRGEKKKFHSSNEIWASIWSQLLS